MRISKFRGLTTAVIAACALLTTGAGAASATPAVWNTTGAVAITPTGSFTIKVGTIPDPYNTFTCSAVTNIIADATTTAGIGYLSGFGFTTPSAANGTCYDGVGTPVASLEFSKMGLAMKGAKNGSVYSMQSLNNMYIHIFSGFVLWNSDAVGTPATPYTAAWTNGTSATNPSKIVFTNAQVGTTDPAGIPITLTGTFTLKTSGGGLLKLI